MNRRKTRFHQHVIEPPRLAALLEHCRRNNTTATGILAAAALITMRKYFDEHVSPRIVSCVDIRRLIGPGMVIVGPWCGSTDIRPGYDLITARSDIWHLAKHYDDELDRITSDRETLFADGGRGSDRVIEAIRSARQFNPVCTLTDLGQIDLAPTEPFIIENVSFAGGRRCAEHVMFISAATIRSSMFLSFAYTAPLIRDNWAARFTGSFMHILDKAGKQ